MGKSADAIDSVTVRTHEAAIRIIDKKGPLFNPADRDHCLQYMVAVPLIFGRLTAKDYEDAVAADPRIDALRARIVCVEEKSFSRDYLDPEKSSIANTLIVRLKDGTKFPDVTVEYPIGHKRRRAEGACRCWFRNSPPICSGVSRPNTLKKDSRHLARPRQARRHEGERLCGPLHGLK